jgi:hypothetical protein
VASISPPSTLPAPWQFFRPMATTRRSEEVEHFLRVLCCRECLVKLPPDMAVASRGHAAFAARDGVVRRAVGEDRDLGGARSGQDDGRGQPQASLALLAVQAPEGRVELLAQLAHLRGVLQPHLFDRRREFA